MLFSSLLRRPRSSPGSAREGGSALNAVRRRGLSAGKGRGWEKEAGAEGAGPGEGRKRGRGLREEAIGRPVPSCDPQRVSIATLLCGPVGAGGGGGP